jgi:CHAD domain-containing protein
MTSAAPLSLASRIERDCARRLKAWNEARHGARDPREGAPLHDLRVASRRLLVALGVWRELFRPRVRRRARRVLRTLRRRLGPARDLEAQAARLAAMASTLPAEEQQAAEVIRQRIVQRLGPRMARLGRHLDRSRFRSLAKSLGRSMRALGADRDDLAAVIARARSRAARGEESLARGLQTILESEDVRSLHQARILVRTCRYTSECLEAGTGAGLRLGKLLDLQRALGAIHDGAALERRVAKRARRLRAALDEAGARACESLGRRLATERGAALERARICALGIAASAGRVRPAMRPKPGPSPSEPDRAPDVRELP